MRLQACLNGARQAGEHPHLPLTPAQMAEAAYQSVAAGAESLHLHIRDATGRESLAASGIAATLRAVRAAAPGIAVGISTGLWISGHHARRMQLLSAWTVLPDYVSINFYEDGALDLAGRLLDAGIHIEAGLDGPAAARLLTRSGVVQRCLRILLEPEEADLRGALATVDAIEGELQCAGVTVPRLLHGTDATAWPLLDEAARRGWATRAGLEDMLLLPDGALALDNAAIVREAARRVRLT